MVTPDEVMKNRANTTIQVALPAIEVPRKADVVTDRRSSGQRHKTVRVRVGSESASIDAAIAALIKEIWLLGISTFCSCENAGDTIGPDRYGMPRHGFAQVGFPSEYEARRFLTLVTKFEKGGRSLYNRITHGGCRGVAKCWEYEVSIFDDGYDWDSDSREEGAEIGFRVLIYLPAADVPILVKRLRRLRERRERDAKTQSRKRTFRGTGDQSTEVHGPDVEVTLSLPASVHAGVGAFAKRLVEKSKQGVTFDEAATWLLKDALDEDPRVLEEVLRVGRVWKEIGQENGRPTTEESLKRVVRAARGRARAEAHIDELLAIPPLPGNALSIEAAMFLPRALSERAPARGSRRRSAR